MADTPDGSEIDQELLREFGIGRVFQVALEGIILANARTESILAWNDGASRIFGYTPEEALSLPLHDLVAEPLKEDHRRGLAQYQESGAGSLIDSASPVELTGVRKDGSEVAIELSLTPIPGMGRSGDRFALAIVRDITDRKAAEESQRVLFEHKIREQRARELNEFVLQGLFKAKMAFELGEFEQGLQALSDAIDHAKELMSGYLPDQLSSSDDA